MPPYLSSKLYFRMWNYYCGKLQLCWKLYCQPVNINDDSIPTKCCTRTSMNSRMNEKSKYHITTTTVSELWNSDLKNRNRRRISRQITADQVDPNSKTHLWNESEKIGTSMFVTFFYSLYNCCLRITLIIKPIGRKKVGCILSRWLLLREHY